MRIREGAERGRHRRGSRGVICPAENLLTMVRNGLKQTNRKRDLTPSVKPQKETLTARGADRGGRKKTVLRRRRGPAVHRRPPAPESGAAGAVPRRRRPPAPGRGPVP